MAKIDYKIRLKHLYKPSAKRSGIVDVPEMNFLMVDGTGNPITTQAYKDAVEALFALSYAIKFMVKNGRQAIDYGVMPLEGQWWVDDMSKFSIERRDDWKWTIMIMQPEPVARPLVESATEQVGKKKGLPALSRLQFEPFAEGRAAQVLHIGPFSDEGPTIDHFTGSLKRAAAGGGANITRYT
ncbi:MAG TPA: GyrI-like domain-containing protein [bacterium]|nr:GyrI-like domain-containing protein [bacterium]